MALLYWRKALLTGLASIAIAGCLPESQEKTPGTQAPVEAPPNSAPAISGSPATQAMVGVVWQFRAVASDPDGDPVQFRASGLPAWATVDAASGLVSGTPSSGDVGQHGPIIISATDGTLESALPPFLVTVAPATVEPAPPPPPASTPPPPAAPVNTAPVISGVPSTTVLHAERHRRGDPPGPHLFHREPTGLGFLLHDHRSALRHPVRHPDRHLRQHPHQRLRRQPDFVTAGVLDHRDRAAEPRTRDLRIAGHLGDRGHRLLLPSHRLRPGWPAPDGC
jgi:hypothetical protein